MGGLTVIIIIFTTLNIYICNLNISMYALLNVHQALYLKRSTTVLVSV